MWVYFTPYFRRRGTNKWERVKCQQFLTSLKNLNWFKKIQTKDAIWTTTHTLYALQSRYTSSAKYDAKHVFLSWFLAVIFKLMVKITSIFGSYGFSRIAWHDIFSLSDHFPASWNLYIPHDLAELKSKCSSSRQFNPELNHRTLLKDSCVS